MPGSIRKRKGGGYKVRWGGKTVARKTTKKKAKKQLRLLNAVKHGWRPTKRRR